MPLQFYHPESLKFVPDSPVSNCYCRTSHHFPSEKLSKQILWELRFLSTWNTGQIINYTVTCMFFIFIGKTTFRGILFLTDTLHAWWGLNLTVSPRPLAINNSYHKTFWIQRSAQDIPSLPHEALNPSNEEMTALSPTAAAAWGGSGCSC